LITLAVCKLKRSDRKESFHARDQDCRHLGSCLGAGLALPGVTCLADGKGLQIARSGVTPVSA